MIPSQRDQNPARDSGASSPPGPLDMCGGLEPRSGEGRVAGWLMLALVLVVFWGCVTWAVLAAL